MVKQEDKVVCWMDYLKDVNDIVKLEHHVVVCPISFMVLFLFEEEEKEWRLVRCKWSVDRASQDLDGCLWISIILACLLSIYYIKNLGSYPSEVSMFLTCIALRVIRTG